jgi:hypothetical protein
MRMEEALGYRFIGTMARDQFLARKCGICVFFFSGSETSIFPNISVSPNKHNFSTERYYTSSHVHSTNAEKLQKIYTPTRRANNHTATERDL